MTAFGDTFLLAKAYFSSQLKLLKTANSVAPACLKVLIGLILIFLNKNALLSFVYLLF